MLFVKAGDIEKLLHPLTVKELAVMVVKHLFSKICENEFIEMLIKIMTVIILFFFIKMCFKQI
jgi:hypothetical protein